MKGEFVNVCWGDGPQDRGYFVAWDHNEPYIKIFGKVINRVPVYKIWLNEKRPVHFRDADGVCWQISKVSYSDRESTPLCTQILCARGLFDLSGIFHDDACKRKGLWRRPAGPIAIDADGNDAYPMGGYEFVELTRKQRDDMLFNYIAAEHGTKAQQWAYWLCVRAYAKVTGQK